MSSACSWTFPCFSTFSIKRDIRQPDMRNENLLIKSDHNLASINWLRASSGSVLMIVLTPNKAGNLATSESDISERDSCTERDFSSCLGGAAPAWDILAGLVTVTVSHLLRTWASRGKLGSAQHSHCTSGFILLISLNPDLRALPTPHSTGHIILN